MRNASLEDSQLLAESEILQRDLFVAAKDQKDHPKKREDCVQHEAGSVSASSLKINRLRGRWDLARHNITTTMRYAHFAPNHATRSILAAHRAEMEELSKKQVARGDK